MGLKCISYISINTSMYKANNHCCKKVDKTMVITYTLCFAYSIITYTFILWVIYELVT